MDFQTPLHPVTIPKRFKSSPEVPTATSRLDLKFKRPPTPSQLKRQESPQSSIEPPKSDRFMILPALPGVRSQIPSTEHLTFKQLVEKFDGSSDPNQKTLKRSDSEITVLNADEINDTADVQTPRNAEESSGPIDLEDWEDKINVSEILAKKSSGVNWLLVILFLMFGSIIVADQQKFISLNAISEDLQMNFNHVVQTSPDMVKEALLASRNGLEKGWMKLETSLKPVVAFVNSDIKPLAETAVEAMVDGFKVLQIVGKIPFELMERFESKDLVPDFDFQNFGQRLSQELEKVRAIDVNKQAQDIFLGFNSALLAIDFISLDKMQDYAQNMIGSVRAKAVEMHNVMIPVWDGFKVKIGTLYSSMVNERLQTDRSGTSAVSEFLSKMNRLSGAAMTDLRGFLSQDIHLSMGTAMFCGSFALGILAYTASK